MASVVPEATSAGSVITVPVPATNEAVKLAAENEPSSVRLALCPAVSATVNVPLVPVWVNPTTCAPAPMSCRTILSGRLAGGEAKPAIVPTKPWESPSISLPPVSEMNVTVLPDPVLAKSTERSGTAGECQHAAGVDGGPLNGGIVQYELAPAIQCAVVILCERAKNGDEAACASRAWY